MGRESRFDAAQAYRHTQELCYPRRVGTRGERRAARYIRQAFAACGLVCWREPFPVSLFPTAVGNRLLFALSALLAVVGASVSAAQPLAAALCWASAGCLLNTPWRLHHLLAASWRPRTRSENLLATLPDAPGPAPARVIFMAHYDTKSQLWPTGVRVALVSSATVLYGLLTLFSLLAAVGWPQVLSAAHPAGLTAAVVVLLAGLAVNVTGNRSPGALDNGSSVGTLLELARTWRPDLRAPLEVFWVASGAEETGLTGARHFLREHAAWWQDKPTLLINLESVGAGARVYLAGEPAALRLARQVADELELPHARLRVLGAGMDHEPFAARRLPAVSILGDVVRYSCALHTTRDNLALLDEAALDRAGRLAAHLAWRWALVHARAASLGGPELAAI